MQCHCRSPTYLQIRIAMLSLIRIFGIAAGACCAYKSTGGSNQHNAYCEHVGIPPNIDNRTRHTILFCVQQGTTIGFASVPSQLA